MQLTLQLSLGLKTMFAYKSIECLHQLSLNSYMTFHGEKKKKKESNLLLAYIADVSCLTNRPFNMRTMSLTKPPVTLHTTADFIV